MNRWWSVVVLVVLSIGELTAMASGEVRVWTSTANLEQQWSPSRIIPENQKPNIDPMSVVIDPSRVYQTILGLGSSFDHATCYNLSLLPPEVREETLEKLVDPEKGAGMNLMRICIGTPDFTADPWYTYNDLPVGATDSNLEKFSIEKDRRYILPILKLAREKNPNLLFFASPWSPPGWMTSTGDMIGGHLLPEYYSAYAGYFVRFIQAYQQEGISIHAVTIQNEPGVDRSLEEDPDWHYPSCRYNPEQERDFIKNHLGPAFERHGLNTEIWSYDHNFNEEPTPDGDDPGISYPRIVLSDPDAARFVDGVAFHGYAGEPVGMSVFHGEFPQIPIHFTEGSTYGLEGASEILTFLRNFASSYNAWVTLLDEYGKPNRGPFEASRTCVTLNSDKKSVAYHFDYYMYGHFMKFIERGAVRLGSKGSEGIDHLAFENPDGKKVLILVNPSPSGTTVRVDQPEQSFSTQIPPTGIQTIVW